VASSFSYLNLFKDKTDDVYTAMLFFKQMWMTKQTLQKQMVKIDLDLHQNRLVLEVYRARITKIAKVYCHWISV